MSIVEKIKNSFFAEFSFFMAMPALVWQIALLIIPCILLIVGSFFAKDLWSLTLEHYRAVIHWSHIDMLWRSFLLALATTVSCLFLGYPLAYWLARTIKVGKGLFIFFLIIPFCTNLLVLTYSWFFILERQGILNTLLMHMGIIAQPLALLNTMVSVLLVTTYCYIPFMILPIVSSLEKIDATIIEASYDLGGTYWHTFFKIMLPLSWPGIKAGILLVFVPVFGEYAIPLLMGGDKHMFVGTMIVRYVFMSFDLSRAAAFTVISGIFLLISVVMVSWCVKKFFCRL